MSKGQNRMSWIGRDMAVAALEQHARQRDPLPRRAQAGRAQAVGEIRGIAGHDCSHM